MHPHEKSKSRDFPTAYTNVKKICAAALAAGGLMWTVQVDMLNANAWALDEAGAELRRDVLRRLDRAARRPSRERARTRCSVARLPQTPMHTATRQATPAAAARPPGPQTNPPSRVINFIPNQSR